VEKANKPAFETSIRIVYLTSKNKDKRYLKQKVSSVSAAFKQFHSASMNGFDYKYYFDIKKLLEYRDRVVKKRKQYLNTEELATIFHLPNILVETPGIFWVTSRKFEPPTNLPTFKNSEENELTLLGRTNFRDYSEEFGILPDDRRRHIYIIGKTGMGKSTLLENMLFSDIYSGRGVAVVDPHGELAESVLSYIPKRFNYRISYILNYLIPIFFINKNSHNS